MEFNTPESRVQRVMELTAGRGADVVGEFVGLPAVVGEGIQMVRNGEFPAGSKVLYAHLGGVPALNAYSFLFRNG